MTKVLKCAYMHLLLKCEAIIVTEEKIRPNIKIHWPHFVSEKIPCESVLIWK